MKIRTAKGPDPCCADNIIAPRIALFLASIMLCRRAYVAGHSFRRRGIQGFL